MDGSEGFGLKFSSSDLKFGFENEYVRPFDVPESGFGGDESVADAYADGPALVEVVARFGREYERIGAEVVLVGVPESQFAGIPARGTFGHEILRTQPAERRRSQNRRTHGAALERQIQIASPMSSDARMTSRRAMKRGSSPPASIRAR